MIEHALFAALGALVAGLFALIVFPAFSRRAARLTTRRLVGQLPMTLEEIAAERDGIRAAAAAEHRRLEQRVEAADQRYAADAGELGRRAATIVGLQGERATLTAERDALRQELAAAERAEREVRAEAGTMQQGFYGLDALLDHETSAWAIRERETAALRTLADERGLHIEALETRGAELDATVASQSQDLADRDAWAAEQAIALAGTEAARVAALMRAETGEREAAETEAARVAQIEDLDSRLAEQDQRLAQWASLGEDLRSNLARTETERDAALARAQEAEARIVVLEGEHRRAMEAHEEQRAATAAELAAVRDQHAVQQGRAESLEVEKETAQRRVAELERAHDIASAEVTARTQSIVDLQAQLATARGGIDEHEAAALRHTADWQLRAATLAAELATLEHDVAEQAAAMHRIEAERDEAIARAQTAEQRADEAEQAKLKMIAELGTPPAVSQDSDTLLRDTIVTIGAEVVRLSAQLGDAAPPPSDLARRLDGLRKRAASH